MELNADRPSHVGSRPVLLLTAGLWACVWVVFTARSWFQVDNFWALAVARLVNMLVGGSLSWGIYLFLRSQAHRRFVVLLAEALILSMTAAVVFGMLSQEVIEFITRPPPEPDRSYIDVLLDRTQASPWVFLAWCCGFLALDYNERLRTNELRMVELQALAADAENRMLRYQIQPHFLFNTLTALSTLILDRENERAERMVMALSRFLRHSLVRSPEDRAPIRGEVEAQEQYLGIEQERFGDRLRFEKHIEPEAERLMVPSLILQPLIENAVKYAVAASSEPTTIELIVRRIEDRLEISVCDNGRAVRPVASGMGLGLTNVRRRLAVAYGERAEFDHGPRPGGGYMSRILMPAEAA
jgi:two-component system LytT family sensor kinase